MRSFFAFLERYGAASVLASDLERAVPDPNVRDLLRKEGIVRAAPRAKGWACGGEGCERAVVERRGGKLVAVCTREPPACEMVAVTESDLAQVSISLDALVAVAQRITRADVPEMRATSAAATLVGTASDGGPDTEIWLATSPWTPAFRAWLTKRERAPVATRVLVPTRTRLDDGDVVRRGSSVTIEAMADAWTVRGGKLAATRALRVVPGEPALQEPRRKTGVRIPRAARWRDYDIHVVDSETIVVRAGGEAQRFTHVDLGMAGSKSRKPKKAWALLLLVCEGGGMFRWKNLGTFGNAKKIVSELRAVMKAKFGVSDDPFEPFSYDDQWRSKFRAWPDPPRDD